MEFIQRNNIKANYQMGLGPMSDVFPIEDWAGRGVAIPSSAVEAGFGPFISPWSAWSPPPTQQAARKSRWGSLAREWWFEQSFRQMARSSREGRFWWAEVGRR